MLASACVQDNADVAHGPSVYTYLPDGPTKADAVTLDGTTAGIVALLNAHTTTVKLLDEDVDIDARAAVGLIAWRNGPDGLYPSLDDHLFTDLDDVTRVRWVGPTTVQQLGRYAERLGLRNDPSLDAVVGTFEGQRTTVFEAQNILRVANDTPPDVLDEVVGLDRRAVESIVTARPIYTLERLTGLVYVGQDTLLALRDFAEASDCHTADACGAGASCAGLARLDGRTVGKCRSDEALEGEGDACQGDAACGAGLLCSSQALGQGEGVCMPAWMTSTFVQPHPAATTERSFDLQTHVAVYGNGDVVEEVTFVADASLERPEDFLIFLTSPTGDRVVVFDGAQDDVKQLASPRLLGGFVEGSDPNGRWTVSAYNRGQRAATLHSFALVVRSHW